MSELLVPLKKSYAPGFLDLLKQSAISLYELPVEFWKRVLDEEMHFHLGHFPLSDTSFEDSMLLAVRRLASGVPLTRPVRVLDIGCGWGGPAFELNRLWQTEVFGVTISKSQTAYVNARAEETGVPVHANTLDADAFDFNGIGTFDVFWLYESLDHIINRQQLFARLHSAAMPQSYLALATHCKSRHSSEELYGDFMGIQPIQTISEIAALIEDEGWNVLTLEDCTNLTFPVWGHWKQRLKWFGDRPEATLLSAAFAQTETSYWNGTLHSIQLIAARK